MGFVICEDSVLQRTREMPLLLLKEDIWIESFQVGQEAVAVYF